MAFSVERKWVVIAYFYKLLNMIEGRDVKACSYLFQEVFFYSIFAYVYQKTYHSRSKT